jgi:uncharacterized protein (DUF4415 family)
MMTSEQMRQARETGQSKSDWNAIRDLVSRDIEPEEDDDAPDMSILMQESLKKRPAGRPVGSGNKEQVAIRFDRDVLAAFRATGSGWQTRMNMVLVDYIKTHSLS